ncbi:MAG: pseudouridine synthase, partial [Bacteroidota bacterium]
MKRPKAHIVYEDEALIYVFKPANFLTIPDRYAPGKPNLYHQLERQFGKIFIVHRLDKETSGGLLFAKTEAAHKHLSL